MSATTLASPSARRRKLAQSGERLTRSTSNWRKQACSAGNKLAPHRLEAVERGVQVGGSNLGRYVLCPCPDLGGCSRTRPCPITAAAIPPAAIMRAVQDSWPALITFMHV